MQILRKSTQVIVRVGPFVDVGDGFTPQTDITLSGNEAELLKDASVEVDISGRTWAAVTNCRGWYDLTLTIDDTDTVGLLTVVVQDDSDCLPVFRDFQVVGAVPFDELFGGAAAGIAGALATYDPPTKSEMDTGHGLLATEVKQDIIDTVADGIQTDLSNATDGLGALKILIDAVPTAAETQAEMEENGASILDTLRDDLADGGRLDLLIDAIKAKTDVGATEAKQDIIDTNVDDIETAVITNAAGTDIAADIIAVKAETALIVADTNELQTDNIPGAISTHDGKLDTVDGVVDTILVDTNELQGLIASSKIAAQVKGLDDDVITSAKYDESTAHPITTAMQKAGTTLVTAAVAADGSNSTTQFKTDLSEVTDDHYNGRIVIFTSGNLQNQATDITDYDGTNKIITVTAMTEIPAASNTFVIV